MALFPHPNPGKVCLLLSELCSLALECLSAPKFLACLGSWNHLREKFKWKQMRLPSSSLLLLSPPVFLLQNVLCGFDSLLATWVRAQSLFSLCDSICSVTYLLFENKDFPYFHPLLCCHDKHVLSLFASPTVPSDRSSRTPEVAAGVFLFLIKSVTLWGSPFSRGCALNPKIVWSIPKSNPQVLIQVMVDFCSHGHQHHLSDWDSQHVFSEGYSRGKRKCVCFHRDVSPAKYIFL